MNDIQALDRTQPCLPIKPVRCQTITHDYKRHGTTTFFGSACSTAPSSGAACSAVAISNSSGCSTPSTGGRR
jgi:hypothetical protein